jgi:hypothetical protein
VADLDAGEVTVLRRAWHAGDEDAYRRVSSILYGVLRRQAAHYMRHKRLGGMLQTTGPRTPGVHAAGRRASSRLAGPEAISGGRRSHDATGARLREFYPSPDDNFVHHRMGLFVITELA